MHEIDTKYSVDGKFVDRDPKNGVRGTDVDADYMNMLQEELCSIVELSGKELDGNNQKQVLEVIKSITEEKTKDVKHGVTSINTRKGVVTVKPDDIGLGKISNKSKSQLFDSIDLLGRPTSSNDNIVELKEENRYNVLTLAIVDAFYAPDVLINPASSVTTSSMILNATINLGNKVSLAFWLFEYRELGSSVWNKAGNEVSTNKSVQASVKIDKLKPSTIYEYRCSVRYHNTRYKYSQINMTSTNSDNPEVFGFFNITGTAPTDVSVPLIPSYVPEVTRGSISSGIMTATDNNCISKTFEFDSPANLTRIKPKIQYIPYLNIINTAKSTVASVRINGNYTNHFNGGKFQYLDSNGMLQSSTVSKVEFVEEKATEFTKVSTIPTSQVIMRSNKNFWLAATNNGLLISYDGKIWNNESGITNTVSQIYDNGSYVICNGSDFFGYFYKYSYSGTGVWTNTTDTTTHVGGNYRFNKVSRVYLFNSETYLIRYDSPNSGSYQILQTFNGDATSPVDIYPINNSKFFFQGYNGLYRFVNSNYSNDYGSNWYALTNDERSYINPICILAQGDSTREYLLLTDSSSGALKYYFSKNFTDRLLASNLTGNFVSGTYDYNSNTWWICTSDGLFITKNTAVATWGKRNSTITSDCNGIVYYPPTNTYYMARSSGIWKSTDEGYNWSRTSITESISGIACYSDSSMTIKCVAWGQSGIYALENKTGEQYYLLSGFTPALTSVPSKSFILSTSVETSVVGTKGTESFVQHEFESIVQPTGADHKFTVLFKTRETSGTYAKMRVTCGYKGDQIYQYYSDLYAQAVYKTVTLRGDTLNSTTIPSAQIKGMVFSGDGVKRCLQSNDIKDPPNTAKTYFIQQTDPNFGAFGSVAVNYIVKNRKYNLDWEENKVVDGVTRSIYTTLSQDYLNPGRNVFFCKPDNGSDWRSSLVYNWETVASNDHTYSITTDMPSTTLSIPNRYLTNVIGIYKVYVRIIGKGGSGCGIHADGYRKYVRWDSGAGGGAGGDAGLITNAITFEIYPSYEIGKNNKGEIIRASVVKSSDGSAYAGYGGSIYYSSQTSINTDANGAHSQSDRGYANGSGVASQNEGYLWTETYNGTSFNAIHPGSYYSSTQIGNSDNSGHFQGLGTSSYSYPQIPQNPLFTNSKNNPSVVWGASSASHAQYNNGFYISRPFRADDVYCSSGGIVISGSRYSPNPNLIAQYPVVGGAGGTLTGNLNQNKNKIGCSYELAHNYGSFSNGWFTNGVYEYNAQSGYEYGNGGGGSGSNALGNFTYSGTGLRGLTQFWWRNAQYYRITFDQVIPWGTTLIYLNPNLTSSTYIGDSPNYNNPASADTVQSVAFTGDGSNNIYVQYGTKTGVGNYVWTKLDFGQPTLPDPSYSPTSAQIHSIEFVMSLLYKKGQSKLDIMHLTAKPTKFGHICIYSIVSEEEANLALTQSPKVDFETVRVANDLYNQSLLFMSDEVDGLVEYRKKLLEIIDHKHFDLPLPIF